MEKGGVKNALNSHSMIHWLIRSLAVLTIFRFLKSAIVSDFALLSEACSRDFGAEVSVCDRKI